MHSHSSSLWAQNQYVQSYDKSSDKINLKDESSSKKPKVTKDACGFMKSVNPSVLGSTATVKDDLPCRSAPNMFNQNQLNPSQYPISLAMLQSNFMQLMAMHHPNTAMNVLNEDGMNGHINYTNSENFVPSMWLPAFVPVSFMQQIGTSGYPMTHSTPEFCFRGSNNELKGFYSGMEDNNIIEPATILASLGAI